MIRHVLERGLASIVARVLLDGGAEALLQRVEKSGVLKPDDIERLRRDTRAHLEKVRDEGAAYADVVQAALKEFAVHLPEVQDILRQAGKLAVTVAAGSAEAAAARAKDLADKLRPAQAGDAGKAP
jgi:hypothetical protein